MEMQFFSKKHWTDFADWIQTTDPMVGNIKVPSMEDPRILEGLAVLDGAKLTIVADRDGVIVFIGEKEFPNRHNAASFVKEMPTFISNDFLTKNNFFLGNVATHQKVNQPKLKSKKRSKTTIEEKVSFSIYGKDRIDLFIDGVKFILTPKRLDDMREKINAAHERIQNIACFDEHLRSLQSDAQSIVDICEEYIDGDDERDLEDILEEIINLSNGVRDSAEEIQQDFK
jgi:hypothetical protein